MPAVVIGGCPTPTLLSPQVIRPSYSDIRRHSDSWVYYSSVPHAHAHFACVISCKTRQSDNARHGDPAGIRKKQLVAFRSWDVVLFAAATSERFPDGTISDVISCRSPRWCGPAMPFLARRACVGFPKPPPSRVSGLFRVTRRKIWQRAE
jgi:hypothetical protein